MELLNPKLRRILVFFRLIDDNDGNLSFTSIGMIVVLAKLCSSHDTSVLDLGGLLIGLANLNIKKYINVLGTVQSVSDKIIHKSEELSQS